MVIIAAGDISEYALVTLQADGWKVMQVDPVQNPSMRDDGKYPERFWAVYTKLHVFGMAQYDTGTPALPHVVLGMSDNDSHVWTIIAPTRSKGSQE
jgi:hypothetical protein